jgi:hypothetical protein
LKKKEESKLQLRVLNDVFPEQYEYQFCPWCNLIIDAAYSIAKALAEGRKVEPEKKPNVTIFFSDIGKQGVRYTVVYVDNSLYALVGFTNISSMLSPIKAFRASSSLCFE